MINDYEQPELPEVEGRKPKVEKAFCCRRGKCPTVQVHGDVVTVGGKEEGYSHWTKDNLADFVKAAKNGMFDDVI